MNDFDLHVSSGVDDDFDSADFNDAFTADEQAFEGPAPFDAPGGIAAQMAALGADADSFFENAEEREANLEAYLPPSEKEPEPEQEPPAPVTSQISTLAELRAKISARKAAAASLSVKKDSEQANSLIEAGNLDANAIPDTEVNRAARALIGTESHFSDATQYAVQAANPPKARHYGITDENPYRLLGWAQERLGLDGIWPAESVPLGVVEGNELRAVFVFNAFYGDQAQIHIASDKARRWATRNVLGGIFGYAFHYRKLSRLNAEIEDHNQEALIAALKLGFKVEGVKRRGGSLTGADAVCLGMLAHECCWTKDRQQE